MAESETLTEPRTVIVEILLGRDKHLYYRDPEDRTIDRAKILVLKEDTILWTSKNYKWKVHEFKIQSDNTERSPLGEVEYSGSGGAMSGGNVEPDRPRLQSYKYTAELFDGVEWYADDPEVDVED